MSYRLEMSAEIYDWLAELRDSDPSAAVMAVRALAALADGGDRIGPPLVTAVAAVRPRPDELAPALDQHYQDQLESLTLMRRRVAQAATLRKDLERQLTELEPPPDPAGLRERLAAAIEEEKRLTVESQREQMQVDAFRTRKEHVRRCPVVPRGVLSRPARTNSAPAHDATAHPSGRGRHAQGVSAETPKSWRLSLSARPLAGDPD